MPPSSRNKTITIPDFIEREIIDEDKKDIDNSTLDNILNNLPESNEPKPKKGPGTEQIKRSQKNLIILKLN